MRAWILVAVLAGCATFEDRPLDPVQSEAAFRARSLEDAELTAFLRAALPSAQAVPPQSWGLDELTAVALFEQPGLAASRARLGVFQAAEVAAGARPNPLGRLEVEHSRDPPAGDSPWVLGLVADIPVEVGGRRTLRLDEARHLAQAARLDLGGAAWAARTRVRAALLARMTDLRSVEILRAEAALDVEHVQAMEQRLQAGAVSQPDVDAARIDQVTVLLDLPEAEGRAAASLAELAAAVGLPTSALEHVTLVWLALDAPPLSLAPDALHEAGLRNRLDVRAALARYDAAQSALQIEVARQYPNVTLGPGYLFDQGQHKITFGLGAELPLLDRNAGPIAEAEARRDEARADVLALQARVLEQTDVALARYAAGRAALDAADRAVALFGAREEAIRRSAELGQDDALELSGARRARLVAERARGDAVRAAQSALGDLEDALQRPLSGATWPGAHLAAGGDP